MRGTLERFADAADQIVPKEEFRKNRHQLLLLLLGGAVIITALSFFNIVVLHSNQETVQRIRDCTEPQGRCYQQNQERIAALVRQIIEADEKGTKTIECILLIDPAQRTASNVARCQNGRPGG